MIKCHQKLATKKILLMDDEDFILDPVSEILSLLGHEVLMSHNGEEAIEKYSEALAGGKKIDLVIMDLIISRGLGGQETIKKLLDIDPGVVAIVASAYSNEPIVTNYKRYGFSGALAKPFSLDELLGAIDSVLL